jgi:hypothetical protein
VDSHSINKSCKMHCACHSPQRCLISDFCGHHERGASVPLKMRALRSSQTSQHTRMTRDFKPLRKTPRVSVNTDHHSWTDAVCFQFVGCSDSSANQVEISAQIYPVNLHSEKRCIPVSVTLRQRTQAGLCVQPLACSLSAVQILSRTASQPKNLHLEVPKPTR